jgi:hypothetical protein
LYSLCFFLYSGKNRIDFDTLREFSPAGASHISYEILRYDRYTVVYKTVKTFPVQIELAELNYKDDTRFLITTSDGKRKSPWGEIRRYLSSTELKPGKDQKIFMGDLYHNPMEDGRLEIKIYDERIYTALSFPLIANGITHFETGRAFILGTFRKDMNVPGGKKTVFVEVNAYTPF